MTGWGNKGIKTTTKHSKRLRENGSIEAEVEKAAIRRRRHDGATMGIWSLTYSRRYELKRIPMGDGRGIIGERDNSKIDLV